MIVKENIRDAFKGIQDDICYQLEQFDGEGTFQEDLWTRPEGGGGRTRIIRSQVIEKGGVNFSEVYGPLPLSISNGIGIDPCDFYATGVSIVLHPKNPFVPIIHMNIRYFETSIGKWWFGGGIDLTPHYVFDKDAVQFHTHLKSICDKHNPDHYPAYKKWADDYFYIKHRKETRGVGGIFFDRLSGEKKEKPSHFEFVKEVGNAFCPIYLSIATQRKEMKYTQEDLHWQQVRRGRYVEFNLVWDRGTKFGLETDGRIESILMSMPPKAAWEYDYNPSNNKLALETQKKLRKDIDWVNHKLSE